GIVTRYEFSESQTLDRVIKLASGVDVTCADGVVLTASTHLGVFLIEDATDVTIKNCTIQGFGVTPEHIGPRAEAAAIKAIGIRILRSTKVDLENVSLSEISGQSAISILDSSTITVKNVSVVDFAYIGIAVIGKSRD